MLLMYLYLVSLTNLIELVQNNILFSNPQYHFHIIQETKGNPFAIYSQSEDSKN